jgi:hypothetical protein
MSVVLYELANSRPFERTVDSGSVTRKWIARGSDNENAIATALLLVAPKVWDTLRRTKYGAEPLGGGIWMCTVEYSWSANTADTEPEEPDDQNDNTDLGPESSFDITAGTAHITQGLETQYRWRKGITSDTPAGNAVAYGTNLVVNSFSASPVSTLLTPDGYVPVMGDIGKKVYVTGGTLGALGWTQGAYPITAVGGGKWTVTGKPGAQIGTSGGSWMLADPNSLGTGPNYKNAIGVTRDGVEGTDIFTPKFEFTWGQQVFPVNLPYLRRLRSGVAKTNDRKWRGFATGEVLYLGATGSCGPGNVWTLAHKFAVGENLEAVQLSPNLVVPGKKAWEYLWAAYGYDADPNVISQTPVAAYVEKVYRSVNFSSLGLGR